MRTTASGESVDFLGEQVLGRYDFGEIGDSGYRSTLRCHSGLRVRSARRQCAPRPLLQAQSVPARVLGENGICRNELVRTL